MSERTLRVHHVPPRHRRQGTPPTSRSKLMQASVLMASGSMVSRLLGFVRNYLFGMVLAGSATSAASAFSAANALPNTVWLLVGGGTLNAILVPAIVRAVKQPDRGSEYISKLMTLVVTASAVLTAICIAAVPLLLVLTSGVLPAETYALAVQLGYWMMPQILFSALYVMCGQLLNAHDSFGPYQWAPGDQQPRRDRRRAAVPGPVGGRGGRPLAVDDDDDHRDGGDQRRRIRLPGGVPDLVRQAAGPQAPSALGA